MNISTGHDQPTAMAPGETIPLLVHDVGDDLTFTSSDERVAIVRKAGYLYELAGLTPGTVTVEARAGGETCTKTLHVVDLSVVESIDLTLRDGTSADGLGFDCFAVYAHHYRRNVTNDPGVVWSSSDPAVARFDPAAPGTLRPVSDGGVVATATFGGRDGRIEVESRANELSTMGDPLELPTLPLSLRTWLRVPRRSNLEPYDTSGSGMIITATPSDLVEIGEEAGRRFIRGLRPGRVVIEARYGGLRRERTIDVVVATMTMTPIRVNNGDICPQNIYLDQQPVEASATVRVRGHSLDEDLNVRWASSAPKVLEVLHDAGASTQLNPLSCGEAIITVTCLRQTQSMTMLVCERPEVVW